MSAAISRASVWSEFGQLIVDGALPDPERIAFQLDLVSVALDNAGDLFAWAGYLGAEADGGGVNFSDATGAWLMSAHAWGWHGWTVQLWTSNASELRRPEDIPVEGGEVADPVVGPGSATTPSETAAAVFVPAVDGAQPAKAGTPAAVPAPVVTGDGAAVTPEHQHVGVSAGGPGQNEAECACGAVYAGFDTHAEATAALDRHIADATPDVWVPIRRRGVLYHSADAPNTDRRFTTCGRAVRPNYWLTPTEAAILGAIPCPRCYGGAA